MASRSTPTEIIEIVAKYMQVLGVEDPPEVLIVNNLGSAWLGECHWRSSRPNTTTIRLQKRILSHPETLDRVLAHELVHHWEFLNLTPHQIEMIKFHIMPTSHGSKFIEGATEINRLMGDGYVTRTSDSSYEQDANTQMFHLLIMRMSTRDDRLGWAWAARPSSQAKERIAKEVNERHGRYVMTTDERWLNGTKIQKYGGMSVPPRDSEDEAELRRLYDNSPNEYENP